MLSSIPSPSVSSFQLNSLWILPCNWRASIKMTRVSSALIISASSLTSGAMKTVSSRKSAISLWGSATATGIPSHLNCSWLKACTKLVIWGSKLVKSKFSTTLQTKMNISWETFSQMPITYCMTTPLKRLGSMVTCRRVCQSSVRRVRGTTASLSGSWLLVLS